MTDLPRSSVAATEGNLFAGQPIVVRRIGDVAPASAPATSSLNKTLAILLVAILALAPLPLGSNRPAFWTLWGMAVGVLALLYGLAVLVTDSRLRAPITRHWPEASLFALLLLAHVLQLLPIQRWFDIGLTFVPQLGETVPRISLDPGSTVMSLLQWATFGLLYLLVLQVATNRYRARLMALWLVGIVSAYAVWGLASLQLGDTILGFDKQFYQGFATGTFVNRNSYATFLAAGLVIAMAFLLESLSMAELGLSRRLSTALPLVLASVLIASALFATGSRMGNLSAVLGVLASVIVVVTALRSNVMVAATLGLLALAGALVLLAAYGEPLLNRLVFLQADDLGRTELHRQVWDAILARPLTGYGGGSFALLAGLVLSPPVNGQLVWEYTHSTYLALWFEYGLVVGSIPLLLAAIAVLRGLFWLREKTSAALAAASLGVVVVFACHSMLDFSAEIEANAFVLVTLMALSAVRPAPRDEAAA